jgi:hypothetical protein
MSKSTRRDIWHMQREKGRRFKKMWSYPCTHLQLVPRSRNRRSLHPLTLLVLYLVSGDSGDRILSQKPPETCLFWVPSTVVPLPRGWSWPLTFICSEVQNTWISTSTISCTFMASCLIKRRQLYIYCMRVTSKQHMLFRGAVIIT